MTQYSRKDVLRILGISARQLQGWERSRLIPIRDSYDIGDMGQLRSLRSLQRERMRPASIKESIAAMQAVAGMANPLLEAGIVRTGRKIAFRHLGAMVEPIHRQLLFDFESAGSRGIVTVTSTASLPSFRNNLAHRLFVDAVQAEERGDKLQAMELYERLLDLDEHHTASYINLGTLHYHAKQFDRAEQLYRRATEIDPGYVLAFFDLGNVLDELERPAESIAAYRQAVAMSPKYADAHYNLALAYERTGARRKALIHWQAYLRLDASGSWADHARGQIRKLLGREKLTVAFRSEQPRAWRKYLRPKAAAGPRLVAE